MGKKVAAKIFPVTVPFSKSILFILQIFLLKIIINNCSKSVIFQNLYEIAVKRYFEKILTVVSLHVMINAILKDEDAGAIVLDHPGGVKAIRTAGSTAADGNFGCLID